MSGEKQRLAENNISSGSASAAGVIENQRMAAGGIMAAA